MGEVIWHLRLALITYTEQRTLCFWILIFTKFLSYKNNLIANIYFSSEKNLNINILLCL
jgi:hypothetical protein